MSEARLPFDEAERLAALYRLELFDTPAEPSLAALVRGATLACTTCCGAVELLGADFVRTLAPVGLPAGSTLARDQALCSHAILGDDVLEVADMRADPRSAAYPIVTGEPHLRFYAGMPLRLRDGQAIGALCVSDTVPRRLTDAQRAILRNLAQAAAAIIEHAQATRQLAEAAASHAAAETRLRRSEEFLDRTGRAAGVGGWELDLVTQHLHWSAETKRIHGVAADYEPNLATAIDFYAPDSRPVIRAAVERAMATGESWDLELELVRQDGTAIWVRAMGSATFVDGTPVRLGGAFQDVSGNVARQLEVALAHERVAAELKRNADLQAETFAREAALFRNSPDSLSILRIDEAAGARVYRFEAISPSVANVTGLQPADLLGQCIGSGLPAPAAAALLQSCDDCVAANETVAFSFSLDTPGGRRELEGSRTPIHDPATGRIVRLAGVVRDVTERKRLEAIATHAQKMEAVGTLAAGVAHDFNNILQSISGSLEMVQDEVATGSQAHDFAGVGLRAARRGAYLTHHLLSYARRQTMQPQEVDLAAMLADLQILLRRTLGPQIALRVQLGRAVPRVRVDPGQMQTALLNLAINAAHAMPDGGPLLIEAQPVLDQGARWVAISVTDEGCGMDQATLARAAEPFFTTKGVKGTGLGLSMVQGFAAQSGGRLSIVSALGRGTTVAFWLPAADAGEAIAAEPAPLRTVLLVDDDPDVLVTIGAFLEKSGFGTLRATNGLEALRLLAQGRPVDALVTDFAMPGMNGGDLVAEMRMIRPDLPAAVISGLAVAAANRLPQGVAVLHKPFAREVLIEALQALLAPAHAGGLQPEPPLATMGTATTERR